SPPEIAWRIPGRAVKMAHCSAAEDVPRQIQCRPLNQLKRWRAVPVRAGSGLGRDGVVTARVADSAITVVRASKPSKGSRYWLANSWALDALARRSNRP